MNKYTVMQIQKSENIEASSAAIAAGRYAKKHDLVIGKLSVVPASRINTFDVQAVL